MTAKAGERVEVAVLSMVVLHPPPDLVGDLEYYVRLGPRGARRKLEAGDLVALDGDAAADLIEHFPQNFQPAGAPPNVVVRSTETEEVKARADAERRRRLPRFGVTQQVVCLNCLATSPASPPIEPQLQALDVASALEAAGDTDGLEGREAVQYHVYAHESRRVAAIKEADRIAAEFHTQHSQCPADAELHPLEGPPQRQPGEPIPVWSGPVSIRP